ncbi:hypothetical protein Tdes44962_MAKER03015 [Teratosphaeria destructans]|uniref:Uncharacterized protein n=1 Tax=Teratosphaeria destructans TaxID=418781 RepID=A0A9W7SRI6_9PEZI|nr:hypothetical protein Tdes44962_MAKER03015 [Teratosphaeria destructans]
MERAAEDKNISESELQAAIDEGRPADEVEWLREAGVAHDEARRGTAKIELQRQAVLLSRATANNCFRMSNVGYWLGITG